MKYTPKEKTNLINGQKPEFGNTEQISWLKKQEKWEESDEDVAELDADEIFCTTLSVAFNCINPRCDKKLHYEETFEDMDEHRAIGEACGEEIKCKNCEAEYVIDKEGYIICKKKPKEEDSVINNPKQLKLSIGIES